MSSVVNHESTFLNLVKTVLNFAIAFEKEYDEKFVATGVVDIAKDMIGSDILTRMCSQYYYRNIQIAKMFMRNESIPDLVK